MKQMEQTILRAKCILGEIFNIEITNFEVNVTRKRPVVEARRFLVYFLCKELGMKYTDVPLYVPAISNHATAIWHTKLLDKFLTVEKPTLRKYETFKATLFGDEYASVEKEIGLLNVQKKIITKQINQLKTLIK